jgi:hypothetical protein
MNQGKSGARVGGIFTIDCYGPDGILKWTEQSHNIVTNVGLDHILDVTLNAATQVSTWYVGLKNAGAVAAGDTMASHAGWVENQNYSEANRVEYQEAASSGQSVTNSANKASFSIDTDSQTIAGAFLVSDNTKGGTTGTLLCVADFSSSKSADNGDTLEVTYTISAADDGA